MRKRLGLYLALALALLVLLPLALLVLAIEHAPEAGVPPRITVADLERAKQLLKAYDPRQLAPGETREVAISQRDMDLALPHLVARLRRAPVRAVSIELGERAAWLQLGLAVPATALGNAVNIGVRMASHEGKLAVTGARVGRIPVPGWLAQAALGLVEPRLGHPALIATVRELYATTSAWSIRPQEVRFTMVARPDLAHRLEARGRDLLLPADERERISRYLHHANALGAARPSTARSLVPMVRDMVAMAAARTTRGHDPRAENRAAMMALAIYAVGRPDLASRVLGTAPTRAFENAVTLRSRADLAQHWLVSAVIALESDGRTADVVGVFKEVLDSRGGSGFSFADLAADRAGVRFGEMAVADPAGWQLRVAALAAESDVMPAIDRLPEGLQEPEFLRRFRERDNDAYAQVLAVIEQRIDRCAFFARRPG